MNDKKLFYKLEAWPKGGIYALPNINNSETTEEHDKKVDAIDKCREILFEWLDGNLTTNNHPCPYDDSLLVDTWKSKGNEHRFFGATDFVYGFNSISQLKRWFYNDNVLLEFHDLGVTLAIYEVNTLIVGNTQSIVSVEEFKDLTEVKRISLKDFVEQKTSDVSEAYSKTIVDVANKI